MLFTFPQFIHYPILGMTRYTSSLPLICFLLHVTLIWWPDFPSHWVSRSNGKMAFPLLTSSRTLLPQLYPLLPHKFSLASSDLLWSLLLIKKKKKSLDPTALCSYHLNSLLPLRSDILKRAISIYCLHFLPLPSPFFLLSPSPHQQSIGHSHHDLSLDCQTQWSFLRTHLTRPLSGIWHRWSITSFWTASFVWFPKYSSLGSTQTSRAILSWSPFLPHLLNI